MNTSMKIFTVVVTMVTHPASQWIAEEFERHWAQDQGVGDGAGSDGAAVGLHREAHPAAGHHGLAGTGSAEAMKGRISISMQVNTTIERGHHDGHHRPGADGTRP